MRGLAILLLLAFLSTLVSADDILPIPPQQKQPWTPPSTSLSPAVVDAVKELFDQGLADPRGCDYREIEIPWGEITIKTHGWVLPENGDTHCAVGWNGLVYPLKSVGAPSSLEKDIAAIPTRDAFVQLDQTWPIGEYWALSLQSLTPGKAALLLRLGRADLAEQVWKKGFSKHPDKMADDPYLLLARPWLENFYDQAVQNHIHGRDPEALALCRRLVPLLPQAEATAAKRNLPKPEKSNVYFPALEQLPELAADQERRAKEPPYRTVVESGQPAQGPERIAALIRDLEQVHVIQVMNPGATNTYDDPIVQALVKEGDAAVGPLIDCWENDPRLTRTYFTEGMRMSNGPLVHVYEPAYIALSAILDHPFYFSDEGNVSPMSFHNAPDPRDGGDRARKLTPDDRKFLAAKMRAFVEKHKGMTLPEQWFADLQDDKAGPKAWIEAVEKIAQPSDQVEISFGIYGGSMGWGFPTHTGNPVRGESLRTKTNPSFSDLLIKRFNQLMPTPTPDVNVDFEHMGNFILALADWDGKAHLAEIRDMTRQFQQKFKSGNVGFNSLNDVLISLLQRRVRLGDPTALQDYADGLQDLMPEDLTNPLNHVRPFQIMWHNPDNPTMQALAENCSITPDRIGCRCPATSSTRP